MRSFASTWTLSNPFGWQIIENASGVITGKLMASRIIPFIRSQVTALPPETDTCLTILGRANGHTTTISKHALSTFSALSSCASRYETILEKYFFCHFFRQVEIFFKKNFRKNPNLADPSCGYARGITPGYGGGKYAPRPRLPFLLVCFEN